MKLKTVAFGLFFALLAGCAGQKTAEVEKKAEEVKKEEPAKTVLFEAHKHNRIYLFDNFDLYKSFIKTGHTAYMRTFIGAGPKGKTLVFGLTGDQKKKTSGIPHEDLFNGKVKPEGAFYGEMYSEEGRYYVFNSFADMESTRKVGEANLRYADIGSGPKGETVIYVLNKTNKKKRPDALITEFKAMHSIK